MSNKCNIFVYNVVIILLHIVVMMISFSFTYLFNAIFFNVHWIVTIILFVIILVVLKFIILSKTTKHLLMMFLSDLEWLNISEIINRIKDNLK